MWLFYDLLKGFGICLTILAGATDDSTKLMKHINTKLVMMMLKKGVECFQVQLFLTYADLIIFYNKTNS
jgi:hypothetical protein